MMGAAFAAKLKEGWSKMAGFMKRLFRGADTPAEEKAEARAVRSGKISPKQYVAGEKSEGEKEPGMMARAKALKSGKMSPAAYAKHEATEKPAAKKMCGGGKAKKMATGGKVDGVAVRGKTKAKQPTMAKEPRRGVVGGVTKMAKGGGVESKGKTRGKMV